MPWAKGGGEAVRMPAARGLPRHHAAVPFYSARQTQRASRSATQGTAQLCSARSASRVASRQPRCAPRAIHNPFTPLRTRRSTFRIQISVRTCAFEIY